jgi:hypothetical protein
MCCRQSLPPQIIVVSAGSSKYDSSSCVLKVLLPSMVALFQLMRSSTLQEWLSMLLFWLLLIGKLLPSMVALFHAE